ncbi:SdrD B-like domain-containing protein [Candidatus Margulisiibacteriota bacterium]
MRKTILIFILLLVVSSACFAAWGVAPLSFYYAGGTGNGSSASIYSENSWDYAYSYHVMGASGDTIMGTLDSQLQFEERDGYNEMAYLHMGITGRTYSLTLGDNYARFSELTLNSMGYQGAGLTLKPSKSFMFTMVGGSRGNGYWGRVVRRDTRAKETFSGFRTTYYPTMDFGINATYLTMGEGNELMAYGGQYSMGNMNFYAEHGVAGTGKGLIGKADYNGRAFRFSTTYRDIDTDYQNPVDYISYVGKKGNYSTLSYSPFDNLSISGGFNSYTDELAMDPTFNNIDVSTNVNYNLTPSTKVYYSSWMNDRKGYDRGGVAEGSFMLLSQAFHFLSENTVYIKAQPGTFQSLSSSEESYTEDRNIVGINVPLFSLAHLNIESESGKREITTTGTKTTPSAFEVRLDIPETKLVWEGTSMAFSYDYRKDIPTDISDDETTTLYYDVTFRYRSGDDLSFYITKITADVQGPSADRSTANRNDIKFGLKYAFTSNMYLKPTSSLVEGYVFEDQNGNGSMDSGEKGMAGVMVISGSHVAITDSKGHYYLKGLRGSASAGIDFSTLPEGYICTTPGSSLDISDGRADFGIIRTNASPRFADDHGFNISGIE